MEIYRNLPIFQPEIIKQNINGKSSQFLSQLSDNDVFVKSPAKISFQRRITLNDEKKEEYKILNDTFVAYTRKDTKTETVKNDISPQEFGEILLLADYGNHNEAIPQLERVIKLLDNIKAKKSSLNPNSTELIREIADAISKPKNSKYKEFLKEEADNKAKEIEEKLEDQQRYLLLKGALEAKLGNCYHLEAETIFNKATARSLMAVSGIPPEERHHNTILSKPTPEEQKNREDLNRKAMSCYASANSKFKRVNDYDSSGNSLALIGEYQTLTNAVKAQKTLNYINITSIDQVHQGKRSYLLELEERVKDSEHKLDQAGINRLSINDVIINSSLKNRNMYYVYRPAREKMDLTDDDRRLSDNIIGQLLQYGGVKSTNSSENRAYYGPQVVDEFLSSTN